jgi:hypothetical protein
MAGLGSVEDRVSAYRGNTAPLQQRYAMSQDLLDLLALQKIKSEKESAARQMQLAMGQQAAAQGGEPPTIMQQREKEVTDMTKNELAQQRGDTANQQVSEQRQAMQRMMGGIAGAPGAASAAQPTMMASGGIVAFANGGGTGKKPLDASARRAIALAKGSPEETANVIRQLEGAGYDVSEITEAGAGRGVLSPPLAVPNAPRAIPPMPPSPAGAGRGMVNPEPTGLAALTKPQGAAPAPAPAAPPAGLGALPGVQGAPEPSAAPAAPTGTAADPFAAALRSESQGMFTRDPRKEALGEEGRIEGRLQFPEEQERRRKVIDERRKLYEQEFDPERQRNEALKRYLIGAGGRAYGEFGAGAEASMGYEDSQRAAQRERLKGLEDMEQGLFSLRKDATVGGIGAGQKLGESAEAAKRSGMDAGRAIYGTEAQVREGKLGREATASENALARSATASENALNRVVEQQKIAVSKAANEIAAATKNELNTANTITRAQNVYSSTMRNAEKIKAGMDKVFAETYGMLLMKSPDKLKPADKQKLAIAQAELEKQKLDYDNNLETELVPIKQVLGLTSGDSGYTVKEKK